MALNPSLRDWQGRRAWLVGASTGIGQATAHALHSRGAQVIVSARPSEALRRFAEAHPGAQVHAVDATQVDSVSAAARAVFAGGPVDLIVYCAGYYRAQRATAFDLAEMRHHLDVNYIGALNLLDAVLPRLLAQGHGHLSLVSSVAGFRGLPKGLAYGPTKAALTHLAENLYADLHPRGLGVSVVHPGFVATPLTAANDFSMPALITPAQAAEALLAGWARGRFEIDFPRRFTVAMKLLRRLPYRLYFPLVKKVTGL